MRARPCRLATSCRSLIAVNLLPAQRAMDVAAHRRMDGDFRAADAGRRGPTRAVPRPARGLRTECRPGGDADVVTVRERELRRATQAEHGKAVIAADEADGENAAGRGALRSSRSTGVDLVGDVRCPCCQMGTLDSLDRVDSAPRAEAGGSRPAAAERVRAAHSGPSF